MPRIAIDSLDDPRVQMYRHLKASNLLRDGHLFIAEGTRLVERLLASPHHGERMAQRWQASATYTLSWFWDAENQPFSGLNIVPFSVAKDLGNNFTLGQDDQRHRFVFNGIWAVGKGVQVSAVHYLGAGIRSNAQWGADLRGIQGANGQDAAGDHQHSRHLRLPHGHAQHARPQARRGRLP